MVAISNTHTAVRALQGVSAIGAMIFISLGYIEYTTGQLSSGAAIFSTVANYTALLSSVYYVGALRMLSLSSSAPRTSYQRLTDGAIAVALTLAGIFHMTSEAKEDCKSQNILFSTYHGRDLFRCGQMTFGIILTFVTAGLFFLTAASSFCFKSSSDASLVSEEAPSAAQEYANVQTPVDAKGLETSTAPVNRPALRALRLGGRAVQFACSAAAFVFTIAGFKHYYTGQYLSPKATYAILATYTCAGYSLWHLVAVEHFKLTRRPALKVERIIDALLAFAMLVAGVVVATSSQITNCDEANAKFEANHKTTLFRCGSMNSGVVFTLISVGMYLVTIVASFMSGAVEENGRLEPTPVNRRRNTVSEEA
ncbi:hypothetical protein AC1031_012261 [Aphanomyces cochlioides]|nr:hypothetical protein AC1031_012258 [Aphanomyces cochlioides]KAG9399306.1 hypothetical protein AC1031_012261 [Aphanomyces cochlioides]